MWRWTVLALVAANGAFWLWSHGELRSLGLGPLEVAEPERMKTQVQPEALRVTPQEAATPPVSPPASAPLAVPNPSPAPSNVQGK